MTTAKNVYHNFHFSCSIGASIVAATRHTRLAYSRHNSTNKQPKCLRFVFHFVEVSAHNRANIPFRMMMAPNIITKSILYIADVKGQWQRFDSETIITAKAKLREKQQQIKVGIGNKNAKNDILSAIREHCNRASPTSDADIVLSFSLLNCHQFPPRSPFAFQSN